MSHYKLKIFKYTVIPQMGPMPWLFLMVIFVASLIPMFLKIYYL